MMRPLIVLLALSVPAQAGDPAQYNLVQSASPADKRWYGHSVPASDFQVQLDRIEAILRAICERQAIGQPTAREAATTCPEEPKP